MSSTDVPTAVAVGGPADGLRGEVDVAGLKTAAVPVLAAAVAIREQAVLENVPDLLDVRVMVQLARRCGVPIHHDPVTSTVRVEAFDQLGGTHLDDPVAATCHGPLYLVPALGVVSQQVWVGSGFGGCEIGARPTAHLEAMLRAGGYEVEHQPGGMEVRRGTPEPIDLNLRDLPDWWVMRSGATKAAIILGIADGQHTRLRAPYVRAPVLDLLAFGSNARGSVAAIGPDALIVEPGEAAGAVRHRLRGDYLEALTWLGAVAVATGEVTVRGFDPTDCAPELELLASMGAELAVGTDRVRIVVEGPLRARSFATDTIDTDAQPVLGAAMALARGSFEIVERIWSHRFGWAAPLHAKGAALEVTDGRRLTGHGVDALRPGAVRATDLRTAVALAVAALRSTHATDIKGWEHVARGIEGFGPKLQALGGTFEVTASAASPA
jgi:UDP-N-acetylglucosamine 1-carboxyvinyltransferase